jgi:hypothetical protein
MTEEERKEYGKKYYEKNREKMKENSKKNRENNKEYYKKYLKAWREKNKEKIKEYEKEYGEKNREKKREYDKEYREKNREKRKAYSESYYQDNKERLNEKNKAWREDNREAINKHNKVYREERRKTDPLYKLKENLRNTSRRAWKGEAKPKTTEELLGCSYNDFKDYITAQFVGNMSWGNYGDVWHVDHIIPLATVEDVSQTELISSLCHYSNLQPLFACHNISKNDRLDYEYPAIYKTNLLHNSNKKQL